VVAYQKILQLSYIDKFLGDIQLEFRDAYKNKLQLQQWGAKFDFKSTFDDVLKEAEEWGKKQELAPRAMKTFEESKKSKKTVASMIERKGEDKENKENKKNKKVESNYLNQIEMIWNYSTFINFIVKLPEPKPVPEVIENTTSDDLIAQRRLEFIAKQAGGKKSKPVTEKL